MAMAKLLKLTRKMDLGADWESAFSGWWMYPFKSYFRMEWGHAVMRSHVVVFRFDRLPVCQPVSHCCGSVCVRASDGVAVSVCCAWSWLEL